MNTEICIIHSSPIIQKGLEAILLSISAHKVNLVKYPSDLQNLKHAKNTRFIIFAETELSQEYHQALHSLKAQNNIHIVGIMDENEEIDSLAYSNIITHYSSIADIAPIIENLESSKIEKSQEEESESLSSREKEVLEKVALGFSNKEIAEKLFISIHTVISHRKNIVEKTGIKSISGLTMYAIMTKIIDPETIDISKLI